MQEMVSFFFFPSQLRGSWCPSMHRFVVRQVHCIDAQTDTFNATAACEQWLSRKEWQEGVQKRYVMDVYES